MDIDNESDHNSNNDCDVEVANCGISEASRDNEEVQDDDLDDDENEDNDDGSLNISDDENGGVRSQACFSRKSKKKTLTKKNAHEGLKERNSPKSKKIISSCDLRKRKEHDPDKSRPLKKLKHKTLPKKTETEKKSKKIKTKLATDGLKVISRKTKQVDVQYSPIEKTSEDSCGESMIDNTGEDAGSTDHEGDVGIISKTIILRKSTKSKTSKPEKAVKGELMKERNLPRKSDIRKFLKTIESTEVVAGLVNERKSAEKKNLLSTVGESVDKEHGGTRSKNSSFTQSTKFTKLKTKEDIKEGQSNKKKTPKTTKSKKNLVWTKLMNSTWSSDKSNSKRFEENDGDSADSDCYTDAVDMVFSGKTQDEREGDLYDDSSNDDESLGGKLMDDEDRDREGNATGDGDKYVGEADDRRNGSHYDNVGHKGKIVSRRGMKKTLQIGGDGVRSSTDEKGGDVQENWAEEDASKNDDEGVDGFDSDDSSLPLTGEGSSGVSCKNRNKEAERGSRNSSTTLEEVLEDEHSFSSRDVSDDQIIPSSFLDDGERSTSQRNACPFDHMGKSYRGKNHGCTCMIGNSPRRGKTKRKATKNPVPTGMEDLDSDIIKGKPVSLRLTKPPTVNGLLKDKGKMLPFFKHEAAKKYMENNPATDVKREICKTSSNFREIDYKNFNPIMYTIKSDTNRAICESLITPMPQEWEEPTLSGKDREDHRSALRSIFYEMLLKRGRKNRIAAHRSGKVKINRGPTIKELKKANTAEKRRLKKLEAEVKSDGWIEYDMLPAVYPEMDVTDFIKEIK